jgi:hypothetical protein
MNIPDRITIQAFLLAIPQIDTVVSPDLHQAIRRIGEALAQGQPGVIDEIHRLVEQYPCIQGRYTKEFDYLSQQYQSGQRATTAALAATAETAKAPFRWEELAANILTADDFKTAARAALKQWQPNRKVPDSAKVLLTSLQQTVAEIDAHAIAVLQTLEKRPLTAKGLTYVMGLDIDQAVEIVQWLWHEGYIDRTTSTVWHKVFPGLRDRTRARVIDPDDMYFTLTAKGHFLLHPVVKLGSQMGPQL